MFKIDLGGAFKDAGKGNNPDHICKKTWAHMIFLVKHNAHHEARQVSDGCPRETLINSVCSSVTSLQGIRVIAFLAKLKGQQSWGVEQAMNALCACLTACAEERVHIINGPEFVDGQGHTFVILEASHGLKSNGC